MRKRMAASPGGMRFSSLLNPILNQMSRGKFPKQTGPGTTAVLALRKRSGVTPPWVIAWAAASGTVVAGGAGVPGTQRWERTPQPVSQPHGRRRTGAGTDGAAALRGRHRAPSCMPERQVSCAGVAAQRESHADADGSGNHSCPRSRSCWCSPVRGVAGRPHGAVRLARRLPSQTSRAPGERLTATVSGTHTLTFYCTVHGTSRRPCTAPCSEPCYGTCSQTV